MSEWNVKVIKITNPQPVPNADTLSMIMVDDGYPVVYKTENFNDGDLVAHIPIDSVVPNTEQWAFLAGSNRIKARRFRGQFSMGTLCPLPQGEYTEGQDVAELLGITKYEPPIEANLRGNCISDPHYIDKYTDIEGARKYHPKDIFEGEQIVVLEKIHGANARAVYKEGKLWIGSRTTMKEYPGDTEWARVVIKYNLEEKFSRYPEYCFYYEIYGPSVQGQKFAYGVKETSVVFFDISIAGRYFNWDDSVEVLKDLELPIVPQLFRGTYDDALLELRNGSSMMPNAKNIREGIVIKPLIEGYHSRIGRKILKFVGEDYQLLK
jgi:RNA ligase (TIGR02306 family)